MKCNHVNKNMLHPGQDQTMVDGVPRGLRCQKEAYPGLVVCYEHADKCTLDLLIQRLLKDYEKDTGKKHPYAK